MPNTGLGTGAEPLWRGSKPGWKPSYRLGQTPPLPRGCWDWLLRCPSRGLPQEKVPCSQMGGHSAAPSWGLGTPHPSHCPGHSSPPELPHGSLRDGKTPRAGHAPNPAGPGAAGGLRLRRPPLTASASFPGARLGPQAISREDSPHPVGFSLIRAVNGLVAAVLVHDL